MSDEQLKFKEIVDEIEADYLDKDMIQDNKLNFMFNKKLYRARMPNQREVTKAKNVYHNSKIELLKQEGTLPEKQLREVLKKKGIDLAEIERQIQEVDNELLQVYLFLAKKSDNEKKAIEKSKEKIAKLKNNRRKLAEELSGYLASSIESQARDQQYEYLTSVCTEEYKEEDKKGTWVKVWKSFEDYENDSSNLTYKSLAMLTLLMING